MGATERSWRWRAGWGLIWLLTILEALGMGLAGAGKFTRPELWMTWFVEWGYTEAFGRFIGAVEIVGAVLLLVPRVAAYAAGGLIVVMLGATWTVTTRPSTMTAGGTAIHLVLLVIILAVRTWDGRRKRSLAR